VLLANLFFDRANPFQVTPNGVGSWANCAWDMFGVPAALGIDAMIRATYAVDGGMVTASSVSCSRSARGTTIFATHSAPSSVSGRQTNGRDRPAPPIATWVPGW
jgi:hypothetical protein